MNVVQYYREMLGMWSLQPEQSSKDWKWKPTNPLVSQSQNWNWNPYNRRKTERYSTERIPGSVLQSTSVHLKFPLLSSLLSLIWSCFIITANWFAKISPGNDEIPLSHQISDLPLLKMLVKSGFYWMNLIKFRPQLILYCLLNHIQVVASLKINSEPS